MKIEGITAGYKQTWQVAPYESVTVELSIYAKTDEEKNLNECIKELQDTTKRAVFDAARPVLEKTGRIQAKVTKKITGLEVV